ncbi:hypothetical protein OQA88_5299 [Cercophora sp. LCS_1]
MTGQSPSDAPQPPASAAYTSLRNPIQRNPSEQAVADTPATSGPYGSGNDYLEYRSASSSHPSQAEGQPQPQGRGVRGVDPRDYHTEEHPLRQNKNVDAEQMAPEGEGDVARAVREQGEHRGEQGQRRKSLSDWHGRRRGEVTLEGMEAGIERKKAQQSWAREEVKKKRMEGEDVDGSTEQREPETEV